MNTKVIPTNHNIRLTCKDCKKPFIFTEGEQQFYFDNRLVEPKRCPACRQLRRKEGNHSG